MSSRILIAYYSWSGSTEGIAKILQEKTGGRLYRITPVDEYSENYSTCLKRAREEIRAGIMPELKDTLQGPGDFDTLFIGSPNWCSTMAPPVLSFLNSGVFHDVRIIPFLSHGGGGKGRYIEDVRRSCPGALIAGELDLYGTSGAEQAVSALLQNLGLAD